MIKKVVLIISVVICINASDIVVDNDTGLMWQDSSTIVKKDWQGAKEYCNNLSLGGYDDWRLPHMDELVSITDKKRYDPAIKDIFNNTKSNWYWSNTQAKFNSSRAWIVNFDDGNDNWSNKSYDDCVRCVR
jgi:hypothetical protein